MIFVFSELNSKIIRVGDDSGFFTTTSLLSNKFKLHNCDFKFDLNRNLKLCRTTFQCSTVLCSHTFFLHCFISVVKLFLTVKMNNLNDTPVQL